MDDFKITDFSGKATVSVQCVEVVRPGGRGQSLPIALCTYQNRNVAILSHYRRDQYARYLLFYPDKILFISFLI